MGAGVIFNGLYFLKFAGWCATSNILVWFYIYILCKS